MARFGKHFLLALLLGIGLLFGLPGQVRAEEALTPNLPRDPGDAPEAVVISSEITEEAEVEKIPAVGDRFTPSKWVCELCITANKWLKGDRIIIPFTLYSYEAKYGEHDEKMYAYLVNEAGDVIGYYEDAFTADYETKTVTLEIQGAQALEVGTYYMIYYSTYEKGNLNGRPIPIYVEEYDSAQQYSYVDIPWDTVGKHFSCGELNRIYFDIYPLGYVGHEYFYGLYDSEYNLIYGYSNAFRYGTVDYVGVIDVFDLQGDLRPGTYYLRAFSTLHDKYKDKYFPFYIDSEGTGNTFDEQTGTLTFFGSGEMQKCKKFYHYSTDVRHVVVEPGITTVRDYFCERFTSLESVSLPNGLVSIGRSAFRETALKTIAIPNTVTNIEPWAFEDCAQLETVTTFGSWMEPGDSMRMNSSTFVRCSALTRLEIPSSVTRLGASDASLHGSYGSGIKEIVFKDEAPEFISANFFKDITATVYYPSDLDSWTEEIMQDYGGNLTWEPYDRQLESVVLTEAVGHKTGNIIRWNASRHADLYQVYRRAANETSWTLLKNTRSLAYKDESAAVGVRYYYKVRARKGNLMSSLDIPALSAVRVHPLDNVNMTKILGHKTGNIVYWEAVDGADLYQVFRRAESESGWTLIKNTRSLAYKDESAALGVKYYYKVRARNGDLMSSLDITALSAVRPYPLASVKMTKAVGHATGNIIYWEAVENAKLYQVYRRTADESGWTLIKNTGSLAYKDTEAQSGVKYYYKVVARNGDDRSSMDIPAVSATRP